MDSPAGDAMLIAWLEDRLTESLCAPCTEKNACRHGIVEAPGRLDSTV